MQRDPFLLFLGCWEEEPMAGSSGALELTDPPNLSSSPSRGVGRARPGRLPAGGGTQRCRVRGRAQALSTPPHHPRPALRLLCPAGPPKCHTNKPQRDCPHRPGKKQAWATRACPRLVLGTPSPDPEPCTHQQPGRHSPGPPHKESQGGGGCRGLPAGPPLGKTGRGG